MEYWRNGQTTGLEFTFPKPISQCAWFSVKTRAGIYNAAWASGLLYYAVKTGHVGTPGSLSMCIRVGIVKKTGLNKLKSTTWGP